MKPSRRLGFPCVAVLTTVVVIFARNLVADDSRVPRVTSVEPNATRPCRVTRISQTEFESIVDRRRLIVVPGGSYRVGDDHGQKVGQQLRRPTTIRVSDFVIDRSEVSVRAYAAFLNAQEGSAARRHSFCHPYEPVGHDHSTLIADQLTKLDDPVRKITWFDAWSFARWCGRRLPTEAEWRVAATGGADSETVLMPSASPPSPVAPVDSETDSNRFGVRHLKDNVSEWCWDVFVSGQPRTAGILNPVVDFVDGLPHTRFHRVFMGGAFDNTGQVNGIYIRGARTDIARLESLGFRTAALVSDLTIVQ